MSDPPKLKKSINQVVQELVSLGFSPQVIRDLIEQGNGVLHATREGQDPEEKTTTVIQSHTITGSGLRLSYEVDNDLGHLVSRLKIIVNEDADVDTVASEMCAARTQNLTRDVKPYIPPSASLGNSPINL